VLLRPRDELYTAAGPIESVYFPLNGTASILIDTGQGETVTIITIGNEGMLGSPVVLGIQRNFGRTLVSEAGTALKLPVAVLHIHLQQHPVLQTLLVRYLYTLARHIAQGCACRHLHSIEKQCVRWLLTAQDRAGRETFVFTQQAVAELLGAQRATMSLALRRFKRTGLITYVRGRIQIQDRRGLEVISCPCYTSMVAEYQHMLAA